MIQSNANVRTEGRFGAHMSMAGGHHKAVEAARALGMSALQVFTKSNNRWESKPLTDALASAFREAAAEAGLEGPVGHAAYLINLGSPDEALWSRSIAALVDEVERAEALGLADLVMHPGAHVGSGEDAGLARIANGLDEVHRRTRGATVRIALETTAGQGSCLGHRFEHLGAILGAVAEPERLSVCVDTCHLFAAGYPLATEAEYNGTIEALGRAVGLDRVRLWHLNDSQKPLGSRVDRHAGIGLGRMGLEPFRRLVGDPRFDAIPMILETPKGVDQGEDLDAIHLRTLRRLRDGIDAARGAEPPGGDIHDPRPIP